MKETGNVILAITGASGTVYGKRLFDYLHERGYRIHLLISRQAEQILKEEMDLAPDYFFREGVAYYDNRDINARVASGLFPCRGMAVVPASMGVIGRIASGVSYDLVSRTADVVLKEGERLILVPRETPVNQIHLRNMLTLSRSGAVILPASPGFYQRPQRVEDLVDFIVARILKALDIENNLMDPWEPGQGKPGHP